MTADDRAELYAALILRYRAGEVGPVSFKNEGINLGVDFNTVLEDKRRHLDECCKHMRA
jgi:hypothetical protein